MHKWIVFILAVLAVPAESQGLFESADLPGTGSGKKLMLNGTIRSDLYPGGKTESLDSYVRSCYSEGAVKVKYSGFRKVRFYSEIRIRGGFEYDKWIGELHLREAYADLTSDIFNLRIGQQIINWGRADGFNPTNNLVARNYFVRSPEADDMNMGNLMLRGRYTPTGRFRLEAVWVPRYRYSVYRFDLFGLPEYVAFRKDRRPEMTFSNGTFALRAEWFLKSIDGSVSWFRGFDPMPGIEPAEISGTPGEDFSLIMNSKAFRQQTLGLDFSSGMGSFGVRGEAALRIPDREYEGKIFVPRRDLRYVLGIDRTLGDLSLLLMYSGRFVMNYEGDPGPWDIPELDPMQIQDTTTWSMLYPFINREMEVFNRTLFDQTREITHAFALHPALSMWNGVVNAEIFCLYNISTEEWNIHPRITWSVSDEMKLVIGGQYFDGPENTIYDMIGPVFNGGFMEVRFTF